MLLVLLFAGSEIMRFFGISMPALRIAGGLVVAAAIFHAYRKSSAMARLFGEEALAWSPGYRHFCCYALECRS